MNLRIDDLSSNVIVAEDCKVHDRLAIASLILRSKTQGWSGHTIKLLKHLDLFPHFFSGSRHLGFEDIQTMVDLISYPRKISGLLSDLILNHTFLPSLCNLLCDLCTFQHPFTSTCTGIQREWTDTIRRCNEASTLPCKEVTFNGLPIDGQYFPHAEAYMHDRAIVKASLIRGFIESQPQGVRQ